VQAKLPETPATPPLYRHPQGLLELYDLPQSRVALHFPHFALFSLGLEGPEQSIRGVVTALAIQRCRLEDIMLTSLAPWLRRQGFYLVHACAMIRNQRAILLVGPSGSGKTTTGLKLALSGWQMLANDAVMLSRQGADIQAHATPGEIRVRAGTQELLPSIRQYAEAPASDYCAELTSLALPRVGQFACPPYATAPVDAIYFLTVGSDAVCRLAPESSALAFARIAGESLDRWDEVQTPSHLDLLQQLCRQAPCYQLTLGPELAGLPDLLRKPDLDL